MDANRIGSGHIVAAVGALVAFAALWMPWYELELDRLISSPEVGNGLAQLPEAFRSFAGQVMALLPDRVSASGWQATERTDVILAIASAVVLALFFAVAALGADSRSAARPMALAAALALALVVYKALSPGLPAQYVSVAHGLWIAAAGWATCLAGALMTAGARSPARKDPAAAPLGSFPSPYVAPEPLTPEPGRMPQAPHSVPPPSARG